ncbi:Ig-like domain-containing protein [Marinobacter salinisoli]|uniref:Ig-like domain-containing protein n=1 Tax=Marinobacter salinisoli TaxID=2769486 RepID=A0ABX7MUF4_9GAMM|nr:Ig-like domain-containing protein [Marinobacter salinisoli]QSP95941.1 Ig-like domain-containing protein [Marinobacter salinisoli]
MKFKQHAVLIPTLLLAACGGEEQTMKQRTPPASVIYSYPADGQSGVSPSSSVVLRFSHALAENAGELEQKIRLTHGRTPVEFSAALIDDGRSLTLTPASELATGADYSIEFLEPLRSRGASDIHTPNATGPEGVQFSTRGDFTGIAALDHMSEDFTVRGLLPSPGSHFQPMDFSTFRLNLSQPVHPEWRNRGGTIRLEDADGEPVPANILVSHNRIVIDPCTTDAMNLCGTKADQLASGQTYTLRIQNLPNLSGTDTLNFSETFTPKETGPTVVLLQQIVDSGLLDGADQTNAKKSVLNGQIINGVTLDSVLLGSAGPAQQAGGLFAELAYAPSFAAQEALPLRIPRGSVLTSTSLDVRINGQVQVLNAQTGQAQTTGDLSVTMVTDASGYLSPNPYTDDLNAPRHVTLFMDVAMHSAEAQPNASLSQDLLGVELRGIALVEDGVLTIDAIGAVEPELLGQEYANATIAFRIEAATDADSVLDAEELWQPDTSAPTLVSWMPGAKDSLPQGRQSMQRPGDPVILNFDEPLNPASLKGGITLFENGVPVDNLNLKLDGTVVAINPNGGLKHGVAYELALNGLTDLAGNPVVEGPLSFALDDIGNNDANVTQRSPLVLTTYPGYPCATTGVDLRNGKHGRCLDDAPGGPRGDILPVTTLPADRPIVVVFSQSMNLNSIRLNETFTVEHVDQSGASIKTVSGRLEKNNQRIRFYPDEPWEIGAYYRYTLSSSDQGKCIAGATLSFICGENGLALETDLLVDPERSGGPDMVIYFRGTTPVKSVFTALRNLPIRDTNSNYEIDCATLGEEQKSEDCLEPFLHESDGNGGYKPSANSAKLKVITQEASALGVKVGASVGCKASQTCPRNKFIYQTYGLNTEVMGPAYDTDGKAIGVRVLLYPTLLATTSASVFLDGFGEQATGPQILRMRYGAPTEDNPLGLVEGLITEDESGNPVFRTDADLTLDAPNLQLPLAQALEHNLYSQPLTLELEGPIDFFDDGRMQIVQINSNAPPIDVNVNVTIPIINEFLSYSACVADRGPSGIFSCLLDSSTGVDRGDIAIPLEIPSNGVYLNFVSDPIKDLPATP